jgi:hypothetical protein
VVSFGDRTMFISSEDYQFANPAALKSLLEYLVKQQIS